MIFRLFVRYISAVAAAILFMLSATGCQNGSQAGDGPPIEIEGPPPGADDGHAAPHGGLIVELGRSHRYHAEFVEDEAAGEVAVYILDGEMKPLPIEADMLVLMIAADRTSHSFELEGDEPDDDGKRARFTTTDEKLLDLRHNRESTAKLRVTIDGTPQVGTVGPRKH